MTPRGIRANNPGNIIQSSIAWQGKESPSRDSRFESFDTPANGIRALAKLLVSYEERYGLKTVRGIINRWAPPVENDTGAYVNAVAKAVGVAPDATISTHDQATLGRLTTAIIQHENGQQPYPPELIAAAVASALGKSSPIPPTPPVPPSATKKAAMDPLTAIGIFGPMIGQLIPQVSKIFGGGDRAQQNVALASTVLDTVVKAAGAANEQDAVQKMQADPAVLKAATNAVLTQPDVAAILEVGGGIQEARKADAIATQAPQGFWRSPAFVISVILLGMPFMLLADVFYVHPEAYSGELRTQVVTGVLAVIMVVGGYFLGSSAGSAKKDDAILKA